MEHRAGAKGIVQRLLNSEVGMRKWEKNEDEKLRRCEGEKVEI